jgi:hypothetical protein
MDQDYIIPEQLVQNVRDGIASSLDMLWCLKFIRIDHPVSRFGLIILRQSSRNSERKDSLK